MATPTTIAGGTGPAQGSVEESASSLDWICCQRLQNLALVAQCENQIFLKVEESTLNFLPDN